MLRLIGNEQMKIYARTRTWVMLALVEAAVIIAAIMIKNVAGDQLGHAVQFMKMTDFLTSLVFICTIIVAGDSVSSEYSWGTIKLLLIRPASRWKILMAKYISVLLFMMAVLVNLYIVSLVIGLLAFGISGEPAPGLSYWTIAEGYLFSAVEIVMAATLAFMISSVFRSSSLAVGLSIFLMLTSGIMMAALIGLDYDWARFLLFANTDLTIYMGGGRPPIEGMTLSFSLLMLALYWIGFMLISWVSFTKRDVAGG